MLDLAIVIPTYNEAENVRVLIDALNRALAGLHWEAIFVDDDSPDGTAALIRQLHWEQTNIRVLQRLGRRGLASACVEGMMATAAPYIAVMDGDLQHDERLLPRMLQTLRGDPTIDIVVASRHLAGASMGAFGTVRTLLSNAGKALSRLVCRTNVTDPMSGFFLLRREFLDHTARHTSRLGFKLLVDLLASSPVPAHIAEVPYTFRTRRHGDSKLDTNILIEFLFLLADKTIGHVLPVRFVLFSLSGLCGACVHLAVLWLTLSAFHRPFPSAQSAAILLAIAVNFFVNNLVTFRDRRRRGWGLLSGLVGFYVACSLGAFLNRALSLFCHSNGMSVWLAALTGLVVGGVWNYGITTVITWRSLQRLARKHRDIIPKVNRHATTA